jgi:osmotically-inducible protein OsmY
MKAVAAISFVVMIAGVSTGCQTLTGRTAKEHFNDKWLTHETKATIVARNANALTAVDVDVNRGVVYLTGTVPTAEHKARAEQAARGVNGVRDVVSHLQVRQPQPSSAPR